MNWRVDTPQTIQERVEAIHDLAADDQVAAQGGGLDLLRRPEVAFHAARDEQVRRLFNQDQTDRWTDNDGEGIPEDPTQESPLAPTIRALDKTLTFLDWTKACQEATLGYLQDEVKRLTEAYPKVPLATIWEDLAKAQDDAFRLLEGGRARPQQLRDLYFMATVLTFLMAKGSHDIGDSMTTLNLARTAEFCAKQVEHPGLVALVHGLKSLVSYWADRPEDALHFARLGDAEAAGSAAR